MKPLRCVLLSLLLAACSSSRPLVTLPSRFSPPPGLPEEVWQACFNAVEEAARHSALKSEVHGLPPEARACLFNQVADTCARDVVQRGEASADATVRAAFNLQAYEAHMDAALDACEGYEALVNPVLRRLLPVARHEWTEDLSACGCMAH